jgi:hypothetical protein
MYSKEPSNQFEKRVSPKSKSKFWKIDFSIFIEKFKDVGTSLVSTYEILFSDGNLFVILQGHFRVQSADAILTAVYDNCLAGNK